MNDELIREAVERHGSPLFMVDSNHVGNELDRLRREFRKVYKNTVIAYSVKTNYLPPLIRRAAKADHLIEVVSRHEWEFVRALGIPDSQVMLNGPVKSQDDLVEAIESGVQLNVDSLAELEMVEAIAQSRGSVVHVGLRVAPQLPNGRESRFGIVPSELLPWVREMSQRGAVRVRGLHMHYSMDRSAQSYAERVRFLTKIARELAITPEYLDIGGGMASVVPPSVQRQLGYDVSTFADYAAAAGGAMAKEWGAAGPTLILEPGTATLSGGMSYVSAVVSTRKSDTVVVNGTMFETNPLRSSVQPPIRVLGRDADLGGGTTVYGATCMEIDVLGEISPGIRPGDLVVVENVGAYSLVLSPEFIVPRAGVVDAATGDLVRAPQSAGTLGGFQ